MSDKEIIPSPTNFILYASDDDTVQVGVVVQGETVWLTQKQMAELFSVQVPAINKHLANIFASGELQEEAVVSIKGGGCSGRITSTNYLSVSAKFAPANAASIRKLPTFTPNAALITIPSPLSPKPYATVQNKLHWAITGKTAAEIIYTTVDAQKAHMGLTNWKIAPSDVFL
jgi:hypothetical protein